MSQLVLGAHLPAVSRSVPPWALQRHEDPSATADQLADGATTGQVMEVQEDSGPTPDQGPKTDTGNEIAAIDDRGGLGDFPMNENPDKVIAAPPAEASFVNGGRTGTIRWGDTPLGGNLICAHAFTAGGKTGTTIWGPAGARGNQAVGSVQGEVSPLYQAASPAPPLLSQAWVKNGTGTLQVTRSYTGVAAGNQGNGYFVTGAGAARINQHEEGHVARTKSYHDTDLKPMLDQVLSHTQAQAGRGLAVDQPGAIAALRSILNMPARWASSKATFSSNDTTENTPGGTFDTADVATGTYVVDIGPGMVAGAAFAHRIKTPAEAAPA